jgi:hypothetical protein
MKGWSRVTRLEDFLAIGLLFNANDDFLKRCRSSLGFGFLFSFSPKQGVAKHGLFIWPFLDWLIFKKLGKFISNHLVTLG